MRWIALATLVAFPAGAAEVKPATLDAFDQYIRQTETRMAAAKTFLWADESPGRAQRIRQGEIVVAPFNSKPDIKVKDGLIHDWVGSVFIPGASMAKVLRMVQDYDHHKEVYKPEVIDSKLLSRQGNDFHIYLRVLKKKVVTVVMNTEHEVKYSQVDAQRWRSDSRTTKITEVENPGKKNERELPPDTGEGFLWRLDSFWRFEERDGGVWLECQAISLTRDVPTGLGWLIEPIIRNLPKESLESTLRLTRAALTK